MITRRHIVAGGLGSLIAGPLPLSAAASLQQSDLLNTYVRLAGSHDDRLIIWWMDGVRYGVVDAVAKPLYGMKVGMFHKYYRQPDDSFLIAFFELTYYTDLQTGELLTEFNNPYTGETNKVRQVRLGPEVRRLTENGLTPPEGKGLKDYIRNYDNSLGPAVIRDDSMWIPSSVEATIKFPKPTAPTIQLNLYTTVSGSLTDATNKNLASADCSVSFTNILRWEPWMKMGEHAGHMMSKADGKKMERVSELPDDYMKCAQAAHPKYINNPEAALAKLMQNISQ